MMALETAAAPALGPGSVSASAPPHPAAAVADGMAAGAADGAAAWSVLCVDDEPHIVSALRRLLRRSGYRVHGAGGGAEALELLAREPVDLVISDMRMPGMDGAQLLAQVRQRWPEVTRVLLTGHADIQSTVAAINNGEVYRYITKPWSDDDILLTTRQAFERQALQRETRRLEALTRQQNAALAELNADLERRVADRTRALELATDKVRKNYLTSIKVFSNLIELRGGQLAGHSRRVADLSRRIARHMGLAPEEAQEVFVAGLLHDMGQICLPDGLLARPLSRLDDVELAHYRKHAGYGEQALTALDDMQSVAALIRSHHERYDGKGFPDGLRGAEIPLGACILAVVDAYDDMQSGHLGNALSATAACTVITRASGSRFEPDVVDAFRQVVLQPAPPEAAQPGVATRSDDLQPGMVLARELLSSDGLILLAADQVLTPELIRLIRLREKRDDVAIVLYVRPAKG